MKTFIKNLIKTTFVATFLLGAGAFASAASFETSPSSTGTTSVAAGDCVSCSGQQNSVSINIPKGESRYVTVFTEFMAREGATEGVIGAFVSYDTRNITGTSPSYAFTTTLRASNAGSHSDTARVHGLPSSYKIEYVSGHIQNKHGGVNPNGFVCNKAYTYLEDVRPSEIFSSRGQKLGNLTTEGNSWCAQGGVAVKYRITNTEQVNNDTYSWKTGSWGDSENGICRRDVTCVNDTTGQTESTSKCTETKPDTTKSCIQNTYSWQTGSWGQPSGGVCRRVVECVDDRTNQVTYNSRCTETKPDTTKSCIQNTYSWNVGDFGACTGNPLRKTRTVRCVNDRTGANANSSQCSGSQPTTVEYCDVVNNLSVQTLNENVNGSIATLYGEVTQGTTQYLYFVYGNSSISCRNDNYGGGRVIYVPAGGTHSAGSTYRANTASLAPGNYYYRACAATNSVHSVFAQGQLESFVIRDGGTNTTYSWQPGTWSSPVNGQCTRIVRCVNNRTNQITSDSHCSGSRPATVNNNCGGTYYSLPEAQTQREERVTKSSAELNGSIKMNNIDNGKVFFVYGRDESSIRDASLESEYSNIRERGSDLQKIMIDQDNDQNNWRRYHRTVSGLESNKRHYYRICVEFEKSNNRRQLSCGLIRNFVTYSSQKSTHDIRTRNVDSITKSSASVCGELVDDGGDSRLQTWMEIKKSSLSRYTQISRSDRGERAYCAVARNLATNTIYHYRACSEKGCGSVRSFRTIANYVSNKAPKVTTNSPYSIRSNSAVLPGTYVTNAESARVWFQYGRTRALGNTTRVYTRYGAGGQFVHNFTQLKSNQLYCYRAVIQTVNGTDYGSIECFNTPAGRIAPRPTPRPRPRPVVQPVPTPTPVVEEKESEIDLTRLGLGLSLVRLDIDNDRETVSKGETITYRVEWENISDLDLRDLDLNVTIPREVQILSTSRGRLDLDRNAVFYTISNLDGRRSGSMTVTGVVNQGNAVDAITAEATLAFNNPINQAKENATDYDVDQYVTAAAVGTASAFGLANITFLGWLTIMLGLLIVFLVARWLYLEREELRAQAYVNGYGQNPYMMAPVDNRYDYLQAPAAPIREARYVEPVAPVAPVAPAAPQQSAPQININTTPQSVDVVDSGRPDYRPYKPNR